MKKSIEFTIISLTVICVYRYTYTIVPSVNLPTCYLATSFVRYILTYFFFNLGHLPALRNFYGTSEREGAI